MLILPFPMPMLLEPFLGLGQEFSAALVAWNPYQGELSASVRAAYVLDPQDRRENSWLGCTPHPRQTSLGESSVTK
jgi:hypothetical protein